ncbi:MAG TPA: hypothetical protein PKC67_08365 [Kiritimatiellia bacterium]|nr:hypothetical protein [Kiritimatiellia bacterium]HMP34350.1 hypothetical protein [Kiritimatiellia bacterium]
MYQYRIFSRLGTLTCRLGLAAVILIAFFFFIELARLLLLLRRVHPALMYAAVAAFVICGIYAVFLQIQARRRYHLRASGFTWRGNASHAQMKQYGKFLVAYCRRLATHPLLSDEQAALIAQKTHDASEALHHHPLNDDLQRAIVRLRDELIAPTFGYLDEIALKVTRSKARAAIQDLYQPPFPVIPPLVVFYHQFTQVSEIVDTYIPQPTLREYFRVMRDVWLVMTKGDFMRFGQRLFSGISANPHALGRPGEDLGQAFSIIWLTHAVGRAARLRCCTVHDWKLSTAIADMRLELGDCLGMTRDTVVNDALPILKRRIRQYAPVNVDGGAYVEEVAGAFVKSVDAVVLSISATNRELPAEQTSPGLVSSTGVAPIPGGKPPETITETSLGVRIKRRRRRHRRTSSSFFGRLMQRIVYLGKPPRP